MNTDFSTAVEHPSVYTFQEVFDQTLAYFKGDELAARVWINKYALKDSMGNLYEKSPGDMHRRMAAAFARIERNYPSPMTEEEIYQLMADFKYIIPQGSPMAGIGNPFQIASLSNCFVIGNEHHADSYGAILKIDQEQVQLMKRRGGVGHDLSNIRPKGSSVKNAALTSTGVVPYMERYSNSTKEVAQDGRRGALMLSLSIKHPDCAAFIDAKTDLDKITGANISVRITDDFMQAVKNNTTFMQQYPVDADEPIFQQEIDARQLWQKIVHNAWLSAEPGILFWDTIRKESIADCYSNVGFKTLSTNPCAEIPLCAYDSCRLMAINLYSYVEQPFTTAATFNEALFCAHVQKAQRLMDDLIDLELEKIAAILEKIQNDPEPAAVKLVEQELWEAIQLKAEQGRRTGLGITGEADMLAALDMRYGSEDSILFSTNIHKLMALNAYTSSVQLAKERGAFPIYDSKRERNNPFIGRLKMEDPSLYEEMCRFGRRNIALLTIAPTGTTSLMAQTSSGIEPVFMPVYKRRRKVNPGDKNITMHFKDDLGDYWETYTVFHHKFKEWMVIMGYDTNIDYTQEALDSLIKQSPFYKATTSDVDYRAKVKLQGAIQKWVDHSISVTINMPHEVDEALVGTLYMEAWISGCKGITVYREGSRFGVLTAVDSKNGTDATSSPAGSSTQAMPPTTVTATPSDTADTCCTTAGAFAAATTAISTATAFPLQRPDIIEAAVMRFQNKEEKWIAFIGMINQKPYEIFTGIADDTQGILLPQWVTKGAIIKVHQKDGPARYDFQYENRQGYKITIQGLSHKFNQEYWNYAKLISGTLRHGMSIEKVVELVGGLQLKDDNINNWKNGVSRTLKQFIPNHTAATNAVCQQCGGHHLQYQEGCLICQDCGHSKCD